jgi:hypothetical protein
MRVVVDGVNVSVTGGLAEALGVAKAHAEARGRILVEALGDGEPLSSEELEHPDRATRAFGELTLRSAEPRLLVAETLANAVEALGQAKVDQQGLVEALQTANHDEAMRLLQGVLGTWQAVRDVLDHASALLGLDLSRLRLRDEDEGPTFARRADGLATALGGLREALEAQDVSRLADVVGYDLDAEADGWMRDLAALREHVRTVPAQGGAQGGSGT